MYGGNYDGQHSRKNGGKGMKNRGVFSILAILAVFAMVTLGCPEPTAAVITPEKEETTIRLLSVVPDGVKNLFTTTKLTLTFNETVEGLTADDITLDGETVTQGDLTGINPYTLPISGFTADAILSVTVKKPGDTAALITGSPKPAEIFYKAPDPSIPVPTVKLLSVAADGSATETTTKLTLTFDTNIIGLNVGDITLTGVNGVAKEDATLGSNNIFIMPISGFTTSGTLTVKVEKAGSKITPASKNVDIYHAETPELPTPVADDFTIIGTGTFIYDGAAKTVTITPFDNTKSQGNITITYNSLESVPIEVGYYTVTFNVAAVDGEWKEALGLSAGTIIITAKDISDSSITIDPIPDQLSTGLEVKPTLVVKDDGVELTENTDFTVAYTNNINDGTATATITGKGNYTGTKETIFTIKPTEPGAILVYYWVNAHDALVTSGSTTAAPGAEVTITAQGSGYTVKEWSVDGKPVPGATETTYKFTSKNKGLHNVSLVVEKDSKAYSTTITITVQ